MVLLLANSFDLPASMITATLLPLVFSIVTPESNVVVCYRFRVCLVFYSFWIFILLLRPINLLSKVFDVFLENINSILIIYLTIFKLIEYFAHHHFRLVDKFQV